MKSDRHSVTSVVERKLQAIFSAVIGSAVGGGVTNVNLIPSATLPVVCGLVPHARTATTTTTLSRGRGHYYYSSRATTTDHDERQIRRQQQQPTRGQYGRDSSQGFGKAKAHVPTASAGTSAADRQNVHSGDCRLQI